ncbi:hypothetical protein PVAND_014191 [Polypedilum vanderplanki]|uniref:EndoU domain-containing protein n=1 Tax=Polypedilum vanderplanki TaxID=319348 RepID=A0A9J6CSU7_POLVA|nr:hypothetical protein PVAND_014191 [Polypedilum vanderplanki]
MKILIYFGIFLLLINKIQSKKQKNYTEIATDEEIEKISQELFELSDNNLLSQLSLNLQGHHKFYNSTEDLAPEPLLTLHDDFSESETMRFMQMLYDNYERNTLVEETVTEEEMSEERNFINALLQTEIMRRAMNFLESKSLVQNHPESHYCLLKKIWFDFYPRSKGKNATSSGFEHVFLAESKKKKLIGFHNWIYFAAMERDGALNYKGWENIIDLGDKAKIIKIKFDLDGMRKAVSSIFIGTSPELEFALYTICFKLRVNRNCSLIYDDVNFIIKTYSMIYNKKRFVASAFVMA